MDVFLFFVRADDSDGNNLDLLVESVNPIQAALLWNSHFGLSGTVEPQWVGLVKTTGKTGVIDWDTINHTE